MSEKFDQKKYIQQYNKEHYARIEIKCKPEVKRELVARAKAADLTLSQYMLKKAME